VLAHYGEETREARLVLRRIIVDSLNRIWPQESNQSELIQNAISGETLLDEIGSLSPKNEKQSALKSQALNMAIALSGTRWLMSTQEDTTVPKPILMIVIFWLTAIFLSFSLFAPRNALVFASFLVAAFPGPSF
jgi:hypothetical protein